MIAALLIAVQLASPWSLLAQNDIQAIHDQIVANHPGPVDTQNPAFREWLEGGFKTAMAKAAEVKTFGGYVAAVRYYGAGFRDGHLNSSVTVTQSQVAWPGFIVVVRDGRYVVGAVGDPNDGSVPPAGAELVDCDGRAPHAILDEDVWPYISGPKLESQDAAFAPSLLIDRGNPWMKRPASCRFRIGGEIQPMALRYRETTSDAVSKTAASAAAVLKPQPPVRASGDGLWVSVPSFNDNDATTLERLKTLAGLAPQWRNAPFVVFDVRGNGGGNSYWGNQIVSGLYGTDFYNALVGAMFDKQYVEWRVSKDNIAHVEQIAANQRKRAGDDAGKPWDATAAAMKVAQANGESLFRPLTRPSATLSPLAGRGQGEGPLFKGRVFLLTDGRCGSACLDFADLVRALPNAKHVGLTTFADSVYMESRSVTLPSGIARLGFPVKVYRNRPRGHNEPYVPAVIYPGDINDTDAAEKWILAMISSP
jgi:peptidase S41-like protein